MVDAMGGIDAVMLDEGKMQKVVEHLTPGEQLAQAEMRRIEELVRGQIRPCSQTAFACTVKP